MKIATRCIKGTGFKGNRFKGTSFEVAGFAITRLMTLSSYLSGYLIIGLLLANSTHAQTAPPPTLGETTKGTPAVPEIVEPAQESVKPSSPEAQADAESKKPQSFANSLLGEATITESRRENGQVYLIELEHSSGSKQYIEENDSDGQLSSDGNDLDDTPNLPKWKLGSW